MKSEIIPIITERAAFRITEQEILRAIEELTIMNYIMGAKSYNLMDKHLISGDQKSGGRSVKPKKLTKKQLKDEEDKFMEENKAMNDNAQLMEFPLKINTMRFLAEERR